MSAPGQAGEGDIHKNPIFSIVNLLPIFDPVLVDSSLPPSIIVIDVKPF